MMLDTRLLLLAQYREDARVPLRERARVRARARQFPRASSRARPRGPARPTRRDVALLWLSLVVIALEEFARRAASTFATLFEPSRRSGASASRSGRATARGGEGASFCAELCVASQAVLALVMVIGAARPAVVGRLGAHRPDVPPVDEMLRPTTRGPQWLPLGSSCIPSNGDRRRRRRARAS